MRLLFDLNEFHFSLAGMAAMMSPKLAFPTFVNGMYGHKIERSDISSFYGSGLDLYEIKGFYKSEVESDWRGSEEPTT